MPDFSNFMQQRIYLLFLMAFSWNFFPAQTSVGIGLYPTGTETGVGFRSGKNSFACLDARVTKVNLFSKAGTSSFITELSSVFRLIRLEKIRFHLGIGARTEWNIDRNNKYGGQILAGVEAFPFPFQNAGLFFEAAPFFMHDLRNDYASGLRTVAGFVFYFPKKEKDLPAKQ
jgi:hypothetical protein